MNPFSIILALALTLAHSATVADPPGQPPGSAAGEPTADFVWIADDDAHHQPGKTMAFTARNAGDIAPDGPWLGIQFGPVAKSLAHHLRLADGAGQMVLNVAEGSPADTAGLQQYDVISQIDGKNVAREMSEFLDEVRAFKPNETHNLTVLRAGQTLQVSITVGTRPQDVGDLKYRYENETEDLAGARVLRRGGMLKKDDQGNWVFQGLDNLPDLWKDLPDFGDMEFNFQIPPIPGLGQKQFWIHTDKGSTIRIDRDEDGKISVSRTEVQNGQKTTTTTNYNNEEELKTADPDAYKVLSEAGGPTVIPLRGGFHGAINARELHERLLQHLPKAKALSEDALRKLHEEMKQLHEAMPDTFGAGAGAMMFRQSRTSFELLPDGKIKVTHRDRDAEMSQTYDGADALKSARPDLYRKYERLQARSAPKQAD